MEEWPTYEEWTAAGCPRLVPEDTVVVLRPRESGGSRAAAYVRAYGAGEVSHEVIRELQGGSYQYASITPADIAREVRSVNPGEVARGILRDCGPLFSDSYQREDWEYTDAASWSPELGVEW